MVEGNAAIAGAYRDFAGTEARGSSPVYQRLAEAVAADPGTLAFLTTMRNSQPNLLFGALRWYGAPVDDPVAALAWVAANQEPVRRLMASRRTQTNEVARCAVLLPALALLPQPLAIIEVGASAGLCLLYDRWRYRYTGPGIDHIVGPTDSQVTIQCDVNAKVPLPQAIPRIAWRAGLDLHPVDPRDPDSRRWLQSLVWPEHQERAERLTEALAVAAQMGPIVRQGDLLDDLPALLDEAPADATIVVTHSATLSYLDPGRRRDFVNLLAASGVHRVGAEAADVVPLAGPPVRADGQFVVSLDDQALGVAQPHGRHLDWL